MKATLCCLTGMLFLALGCATNHRTVLQDPVGPCSPAQTADATNGHLVVHPSWDVGYRIDSDYVARLPYDVFSQEGKLVRHVSAGGPGFIWHPARLPLAAGEYRVSSYVPSLGHTVVPVQIRSGQTTTLYLDGSGNHLKKEAPAGNLVLLPDGDVAGWRASAEASAKTK
jgi:hypothetical protein